MDYSSGRAFVISGSDRGSVAPATGLLDSGLDTSEVDLTSLRKMSCALPELMVEGIFITFGLRTTDEEEVSLNPKGVCRIGPGETIMSVLGGQVAG